MKELGEVDFHHDNADWLCEYVERDLGEVYLHYNNLRWLREYVVRKVSECKVDFHFGRVD